MLWLALQARRRATAAAHRLHACALGHAHARLARRGTTVTDAVRRALAAELERSPEPSALKLQDAKLQQLLALLGRFSNLRWPDQRTSKELQDALYDDDGLPV